LGLFKTALWDKIIRRLLLLGAHPMRKKLVGFGLISKMIGAALLIASSQVWSATAAITGAKISYLLNDSANYGYCMARLTINPSTVGLNCPADALVSLDCEGNFASKAATNNLFSAAQLAFVTGKSVRVTINDSQKINGFCVAKRLDVY
jgi:hypothetical protein